MKSYIAKMQRYKNFLKNLNLLLNFNFDWTSFLQQKSNLLIRISAAFFPVKIILIIRLSFILFYLSQLSSKMLEILLECVDIK